MVLNSKNSNIRLYSSLVYSMFNNIKIEREDGKLYNVNVYLNTFDQRMKKMQEMDMEQRRKVIMGLDLPAIAIDLEDIMFDSERNLNKMNKKGHLRFSTKNAIITYEDIPVDLMFNITIATKTVADQYMITEGIYSSFKNNYIKKMLPLPFYRDALVMTPVVLNATTTTMDVDFEEGGRTIPLIISLTVKGLFHSYIDGRWKDVLEYYSQFELVDSDGDGIMDAYYIKDCDKPDSKKLIQLGSVEDKAWYSDVLKELAKEQGRSPDDILMKPTTPLNAVGYPLIEKILLRVWENKTMEDIITQIAVTDKHSKKG